MGSMLVDLVDPKLNGLHGFDVELGMPSSQLLVRWSTSNASFSFGTGVDSSLDPSPIRFSPSSCSRLLLMGNK